MSNDEIFTSAGNALKKHLSNLTREQKTDMWWTWHGNRLIGTLEALGNGVSMTEALAFESGAVVTSGDVFEIDEEFASEISRRALSEPEAYDLVLKICGLAIHTGRLPQEPLRILAVAALLGDIQRPKKKGRPRAQNWNRDVLILRALRSARGYGLPIKTGEYSSKAGAVELVAQAFHRAGQHMVTEDGIYHVWKKPKSSRLQKEIQKLELASRSFQLGPEY